MNLSLAAASGAIINAPHSSTFNHSLLSEAAVAKVQHAFDHAWADSTLLKYRGTINQFLAFCDQENIPLHLRLPADEHLLCAFAASRVGVLSGETIKSQISALKAWHAYNDAPWCGRARLRYVLHGVANLAPPSSIKPPHPPVSRSMLLILAQHLDPTDSFDACCLAAACFAMWGQIRLGEILSPWERSFKPSHVVCRLHLQPPFNDAGSRKCHLPFTKVAKSRGEDVVICCQNDNSDPIAALNIHLTSNPIPQEIPLFSYISPHGWRCLTKKHLLARCNSIWSSNGIPSCS